MNAKRTLGLALVAGAAIMMASPAPAEARYRDGMNLYAYVRNSPAAHVDPTGLTGCPCKCKDGMTDLKDVINTEVNRLIADAKGDQKKLYLSLIKSTDRTLFNLTGIENWLYLNHAKDMTGVYDDMRRGAAAPCMRLCGECVGTDKIGHFFEEGFLYQKIQKLKGDAAYAVGLGEWLEGKVTKNKKVLDWLKSGTIDEIVWSGPTLKDPKIYDLFGAFGDSLGKDGGFMSPIPGLPAEPVGMADLEANAAGLTFWNTLFPIATTKPGGAAATQPAAKFNICDYVTAKWDENKNPNVAADPKPPK